MADGGGRAGPLRLTGILGFAGEDDWRDRLHGMGHAGQVETIVIARADAARRRMRTVTDRGRDCAIMLPRDARLANGAVLHASDDLAIIAKIEHGPRLRLVPEDVASALRLGFHCGNLHWAASFTGDAIEIEMDGPEAGYLRRLEDAAVHAAFRVERPGS
ncbi:MAG: urease accessory protein UreE [Pseudomonadota bacterium]